MEGEVLRAEGLVIISSYFLEKILQATEHIRSVQFVCHTSEKIGFMSLVSHDLQSTMIINQWYFEEKKNEQLL